MHVIITKGEAFPLIYFLDSLKTLNTFSRMLRYSATYCLGQHKLVRVCRVDNPQVIKSLYIYSFACWSLHSNPTCRKIS